MGMKRLTNSIKKAASLDSFRTVFPTQRPKTLFKNRFHQNWKLRRGITAEDTSLRELEIWQQISVFRL